ncbi:MAG: DEAD/DEAH box helicase family protein, partial [Planctomycetia bacterium]|nr:DEAD/DEAH box helicase family protein [Planctomycetia bacterium]
MPSAHIAQLLQNIRNASSTNADRGKLFELICKEWLCNTRQYREIDEVYLWNEWPNRDGADRGIDLVAHTVDDQYYAIQCKDYQEGSSVSKGDIDSFLSASGKSYAGVQFSQLFVITTVELGSNAAKTVKDYNIPVTVIRFDQLEDDEYDWEAVNSNLLAGRAELLAGAARARKVARPHQVAAINDVLKGLQEHDRGKLIMACGTGKTFTALKIAEKIAPNGTVLYLVPSLMLLAQSLREWTTQSEVRLAPIVICSDTQAHEQDDRRADVLT